MEGEDNTIICIGIDTQPRCLVASITSKDKLLAYCSLDLKNEEFNSQENIYDFKSQMCFIKFTINIKEKLLEILNTIGNEKLITVFINIEKQWRGINNCRIETYTMSTLMLFLHEMSNEKLVFFGCSYTPQSWRKLHKIKNKEKNYWIKYRQTNEDLNMICNTIESTANTNVEIHDVIDSYLISLIQYQFYLMGGPKIN